MDRFVTRLKDKQELYITYIYIWFIYNIKKDFSESFIEWGGVERNSDPSPEKHQDQTMALTWSHTAPDHTQLPPDYASIRKITYISMSQMLLRIPTGLSSVGFLKIQRHKALHILSFLWKTKTLKAWAWSDFRGSPESKRSRVEASSSSSKSIHCTISYPMCRGSCCWGRWRGRLSLLDGM